MKKILFLIFQFLFLSPALFAENIFLYEGRGSWDTGTKNLKAFFQKENLSFHSKNHQDLRGGDLAGETPGLLIMPGGESWVYLEDLEEEGAENIRNFVRGGGSYLGICAGAFYATSHREGGAATGPYGIGLLEGTAVDPTALEWPGFIEGVMTFKWNLSHWLTKGYSERVKMLLYGGPSFEFSQAEAQEKKIEVVQRFQVNGQPSMIRFHYGKGKVFLAAPHFEVLKEEGEKPLHDNAWPFLKRVVADLLEKKH